MPRLDILIDNKLGLHARASAKLTKLASEFDSDVWLSKGSRRVNAKSIMGVMMLAAGRGTRLVLEAEGGDAERALEAIGALVRDKFGEGE
jgi:phosphocarrier protein